MSYIYQTSMEITIAGESTEIDIELECLYIPGYKEFRPRGEYIATEPGEPDDMELRRVLIGGVDAPKPIFDAVGEAWPSIKPHALEEHNDTF